MSSYSLISRTLNITGRLGKYKSSYKDYLTTLAEVYSVNFVDDFRWRISMITSTSNFAVRVGVGLFPFFGLKWSKEITFW